MPGNPGQMGRTVKPGITAPGESIGYFTQIHQIGKGTFPYKSLKEQAHDTKVSQPGPGSRRRCIGTCNTAEPYSMQGGHKKTWDVTAQDRSDCIEDMC
eukprot:gene5816-biopygen6905